MSRTAHAGFVLDVLAQALHDRRSVQGGGLCNTKMIRRRRLWRPLEAVEFSTLEWADWFNNRCLLEPSGNVPPAGAGERCRAQLEELDPAA